MKSCGGGSGDSGGGGSDGSSSSSSSSDGEEENSLGDCLKWVSIALINTMAKGNLGRKEVI